MKVLMLDAHPDSGRLTTHLLDGYAAALPGTVQVTRVAVRDLSFLANLRHGYRQQIEWEPDLVRLAEALDACDHLVVAFPMWWGGEPALLKGLIERVFLPGFMFHYSENDPMWVPHMAGRSADVIVTMDTPGWFLWLRYGNALIRRWKGQVLGFVGFAPVRVLTCGPVKNGGVERSLARWEGRIARLARTMRPKTPEKKQYRLGAFLAPRVNP